MTTAHDAEAAEATAAGQAAAARARRRAAAAAALHVLRNEQCGVVSRAQVLGCGVEVADLRRLVRRRELVRVHPRVYVDHTGALTWIQRAWAAVLWAEPAALCLESAVRINEGPGRRPSQLVDGRPIHVAVAHDRRLDDQDGIVVHRMRGYADRVQPNRTPARTFYDEAILDLAAGARSDNDAIAQLADACGSWRTTGARLLARAQARAWLPRRELITAVLGDVATGTCSALEQAYLDRVVRPHGLPEGERLASHRHPRNPLYRDVLLAALFVAIELDGRVFHSSAKARDADMDRDLDAVVVDDLLTVRLSWGQSVDRACETASKLATLLVRRGWAGPATVCPACRAAA